MNTVNRETEREKHRDAEQPRSTADCSEQKKVKQTLRAKLHANEV